MNVALSGLRAFQKALDTTSHNIANVGTAGYSRQGVDLATQTPQGVGGLTTGSGVVVTGINRNADNLLAAQMRRSSSSYSRLDAYASKAGDLNNLFANSTTGLSASLQKFNNALQGVANTPSSVSTRPGADFRGQGPGQRGCRPMNRGSTTSTPPSTSSCAPRRTRSTPSRRTSPS